VDLLPRALHVERDAALLRGFDHPPAQAVAAEAREDHELDVLHVLALVEMLQQAAQHRGLELDLGARGPGGSPLRGPRWSALLARPRARRLAAPRGFGRALGL